MNQLSGGRFSLLPEVVKNLLIINGLFFLATYVLRVQFNFDLNSILGLYYFESELFRPWQLFTHLFMHGSFGHILSNMFALWMFGAMLENVWGSKRFLIYYIVTGLGAAVLHTFVNYLDISTLQKHANEFFENATVDQFQYFVSNYVPSYFVPSFQSLADSWSMIPSDSSMQQNSISLVNQLIQFKMNIPTVGASGAVFGVLLAYGMLFPNSIIYLYFAIPMKVKYFVIAYGAFELWQGFANNPGDNVAHFAHLGGMLFGFLLIKYWNKQRTNFF